MRSVNQATINSNLESKSIYYRGTNGSLTEICAKVLTPEDKKNISETNLYKVQLFNSPETAQGYLSIGKKAELMDLVKSLYELQCDTFFEMYGNKHRDNSVLSKMYSDLKAKSNGDNEALYEDLIEEVTWGYASKYTFVMHSDSEPNKVIATMKLHLENRDIDPYFQVYALSVDKDLRGQGLSKQLMIESLNALKKIRKDAESNLQERGLLAANENINKVRLDVYKNNKKAIDLYEKLGFKLLGGDEVMTQHQKDYYQKTGLTGQMQKYELSLKDFNL